MSEITHEAMAEMTKQLFDQLNAIIHILKAIWGWVIVLGVLAILGLLAGACTALRFM